MPFASCSSIHDELSRSWWDFPGLVGHLSFLRLYSYSQINIIVQANFYIDHYFYFLCVQYGESPLWIASFDGHQNCVEELIKAGANVDVPKEVSVTTCTHLSETTHQVITIAIQLPPHHVLVIVLYWSTGHHITSTDRCVHVLLCPFL